MKYDFKTQLKLGQQSETEIVLNYLDKDWICEPTQMDEQRKGIDYWITNKKDSAKFSLEIKTDFKANTTGNAFIETVSVDRDNKPGWIYTSEAQLLFYLCKKPDMMYILNFAKVKAKVKEWEGIYPSRNSPNKTYNGRGILVPLTKIKELAINVVKMT